MNAYQPKNQSINLPGIGLVKAPECALPPLGVSLRLLRRRVQSAAVRLSEAGNSVEL